MKTFLITYRNEKTKANYLTTIENFNSYEEACEKVGKKMRVNGEIMIMIDNHDEVEMSINESEDIQLVSDYVES